MRRLAVVAFWVLVIVRVSVSAETGEGNKSRLQNVLESWFPTLGSEAPPSGSPTTFGDENPSVVAPSELLTAEEYKTSLPWRAPSFVKQAGALGWSEETFSVPPRMRARVDFWKSIYAKYSTSQGVLHDNVYVEIVYAPIDFSALKPRERENLVNRKRDETVARLQRLSTLTSAEGLSDEDLRVWKMFEKITDPEKFKKAAMPGRVRFQLGQRDRFLMGVYYSGRYMRKMEEIFKAEGLPMELTRLPFVESSFNVNARSKVGASGIWQFMPRTGKQYMRVNREIDERNDPILSTLAAARLLKQNYVMLSSWGLALTGYNHGAYGVRSVVNKTGTTDIAEIVERYSSPTFGFASQNFYACFLAALEVEQNASTVFADPRWSPEAESGELKTAGGAAWSAFRQFFDGDDTIAMRFNPHVTSIVRSGRAKIPAGVVVRVPLNRVKIAEEFFRGKFPASKLSSRLRDVPMAASFDSAGSVMRSARSSIRDRLAQPLRTSMQIFPEHLPLPISNAAGIRPPITPAFDAAPDGSTVPRSVFDVPSGDPRRSEDGGIRSGVPLEGS